MDISEKIDYAKFPESCTEQDITLMFFAGELVGVCCKCNKMNTMSPKCETFVCKNCSTKQYGPHFNPEEMNNNRPVK